jgi:hypothetical protein
MAESLVNPVSAAKLSPRNSEPTHLASGSYEDLGDASEKKANYASSMSADSSIPRAVGAEPTHLDTVSEEDDDEVEVEFGDMKKDESVDDLDKAIDELSAFPFMEARVNEEDDDDEKKNVDEADEDDDEKKDVNEADEDDDEKKNVDEADEDDDEKKDVNEEDDDEKPDFMKKKVDEAEEDDDEKMKVDEDEHDDMEAKEKRDIMAVLDREAEDGKKDMKESLKISIKMPKASLFESAGFNVKQQKKVASIFESAIKSTTRQVTKQIHEHYRKVHVRRLAEAQRRTENRLNTYLDVVVEEWVKTNQVAVRTSLRTELSENFLNGLQKLFTEHYIDVPKSKTDVVKALTRQVETLKRQVNEQYTEKLKLRQLAETANKKRIVATFARDMSEAQAGKLEKLAEDTQYVSAKDFREKLTMLKESYFEKPTSRATRLPDENVQEVTERRGPKGEADLVADAITRQVKSSDW